MEYETIASENIISKTIQALKENGIDAVEVYSDAEAKKKALEIIPKGAEVMTMTSVTADTIGLTKEINESGNYNSIRNRLNKMDRATQSLEMQKLGAAPEWVTGSVHAVTQDGKVFIASASGSQLPAYSYGSSRVVWVVGAQKIVKDFDEAMKRIYEYTLPLENERAKKAYGVESAVSELLIFNKNPKPGRINMIIIREKIGF